MIITLTEKQSYHNPTIPKAKKLKFETKRYVPFTIGLATTLYTLSWVALGLNTLSYTNTLPYISAGNKIAITKHKITTQLPERQSLNSTVDDQAVYTVITNNNNEEMKLYNCKKMQ